MSGANNLLMTDKFEQICTDCLCGLSGGGLQNTSEIKCSNLVEYKMKKIMAGLSKQGRVRLGTEGVDGAHVIFFLRTLQKVKETLFETT